MSSAPNNSVLKWHPIVAHLNLDVQNRYSAKNGIESISEPEMRFLHQIVKEVFEQREKLSSLFDHWSPDGTSFFSWRFEGGKLPHKLHLFVEPNRARGYVKLSKSLDAGSYKNFYRSACIDYDPSNQTFTHSMAARLITQLDTEYRKGEFDREISFLERFKNLKNVTQLRDYAKYRNKGVIYEELYDGSLKDFLEGKIKCQPKIAKNPKCLGPNPSDPSKELSAVIDIVRYAQAKIRHSSKVKHRCFPAFLALAYAFYKIHEQKIAHLDFKPGNVMIKTAPTGWDNPKLRHINTLPDFSLYIGDFGFSVHQDDDVAPRAGTYMFRSPESMEKLEKVVRNDQRPKIQLIDSENVNLPADVWALAMVFHTFYFGYSPRWGDFSYLHGYLTRLVYNWRDTQVNALQPSEELIQTDARISKMLTELQPNQLGEICYFDSGPKDRKTKEVKKGNTELTEELQQKAEEIKKTIGSLVKKLNPQTAPAILPILIKWQEILQDKLTEALSNVHTTEKVETPIIKLLLGMFRASPNERVKMEQVVSELNAMLKTSYPMFDRTPYQIATQSDSTNAIPAAAASSRAYQTARAVNPRALEQFTPNIPMGNGGAYPLNSASTVNQQAPEQPAYPTMVEIDNMQPVDPSHAMVAWNSLPPETAFPAADLSYNAYQDLLRQNYLRTFDHVNAHPSQAAIDALPMLASPNPQEMNPAGSIPLPWSPQQPDTQMTDPKTLKRKLDQISAEESQARNYQALLALHSPIPRRAPPIAAAALSPNALEAARAALNP